MTAESVYKQFVEERFTNHLLQAVACIVHSHSLKGHHEPLDTQPTNLKIKELATFRPVVDHYTT